MFATLALIGQNRFHQLRRASAVQRIEKQNTSSERENSDVNRGNVIQTSVVSINFSEGIFKMQMKKDFSPERHLLTPHDPRHLLVPFRVADEAMQLNNNPLRRS